MPTRFLINQCQIITFLILTFDNIEHSRIELKGIVLPVPLNQIKVIFIILLPFKGTFVIFFLFHIEIEGKGGWRLDYWGRGGGGAKGMLAPPLKLLGPNPAPPPPPSSYAYEDRDLPPTQRNTGKSRNMTENISITDSCFVCI